MLKKVEQRERACIPNSTVEPPYTLGLTSFYMKEKVSSWLGNKLPFIRAWTASGPGPWAVPPAHILLGWARAAAGPGDTDAVWEEAWLSGG